MVANDKNYFVSNNFFDDEINKICDKRIKKNKK